MTDRDLRGLRSLETKSSGGHLCREIRVTLTLAPMADAVGPPGVGNMAVELVQ